MVSPSPETDTDGPAYANITVSTEFRDKLRVAKAKRGLTYEQYLRQHVPIETED